jgi:hypothetical protein
MAARHRSIPTHSRLPVRVARSLAGLAVGVVIIGSFAAVRALAGGGGDNPATTSFTGVVAEFADDGALMCVEQSGSDAVFCDLFYMPPDSPDVRVGDRVSVTTISSTTDDGSPVSGMLVTPLP